MYPLALADELVARGHDREHIRFVGATRGIEGRLSAAGFEIDLLPGRGLARDLSWHGLVQNAHGGRHHPLAGALRIVARVRPAVVVVSVATHRCAVVAARMRRIPVVVHESDARHPGLATALPWSSALAAVSRDTALEVQWSRAT